MSTARSACVGPQRGRPRQAAGRTPRPAPVARSGGRARSSARGCRARAAPAAPRTRRGRPRPDRAAPRATIAREPIEHAIRVVQQIVAAGIGLVLERRDRARARRGEERAEVVVLPGRLFGHFDHAAVAAPAELELDPPQAGVPRPAGGSPARWRRRPRHRYRVHALAICISGRRVRGVVGADHQQPQPRPPDAGQVPVHLAETFGHVLDAQLGRRTMVRARRARLGFVDHRQRSRSAPARSAVTDKVSHSTPCRRRPHRCAAHLVRAPRRPLRRRGPRRWPDRTPPCRWRTRRLRRRRHGSTIRSAMSRVADDR